MSGKPDLTEILPLVPEASAPRITHLYGDAISITLEPVIAHPVINPDLPHRYSQKISFLFADGISVNVVNNDSLWLDITRVAAKPEAPDAVTRDIICKNIAIKQGHFQFSPVYSIAAECNTDYAKEILSRKGGVEEDSEYGRFLDYTIKGYSCVDWAIKTGKNATAKTLMQCEFDGVQGYKLDSIWLNPTMDLDGSGPKPMSVLGLSPLSLSTLLKMSQRVSHSKFVVSIMFGNKDVASWIAEQKAKASLPIITEVEIYDLISNVSGHLSEDNIGGVFAKVVDHKEEINALFSSYTGSELPECAFEPLEVTGAASGFGHAA